MAGNAYEVLGVKPDATSREIRDAYRRNMHEVHPDKHAGHEKEVQAKAQKLGEAYASVKTPEQRAKYDQFLKDTRQHWDDKEKQNRTQYGKDRSSGKRTKADTPSPAAAPEPHAAPAPEPHAAPAAEPHASAAPETGLARVKSEALGTARDPSSFRESVTHVGSKGLGHAMAGIGIAQGGRLLHESIKEGDKTGMALGGANIASGAAALGSMALKNGGKVASVLGKFNIAATVGIGALEIAHEKGNFIDKESDGGHSLGRKGERTVSVVATGGAGLAAGLATTAVLPVAIIGAEVGYIVDKGFEIKHGLKELDKADKELDRSIAASGIAGKRDVKIKNDDGGPQFTKYKHLAVEMLHVSRDMQDGAMASKPQRNAKGAIPVSELAGDKIDMRDPRNIKEFERALDQNINKQKEIMKDNESSLPHWMRSQDSLDKYDGARMQLAGLSAAKEELQTYKKELANYKPQPAAPAVGDPKLIAQVKTGLQKMGLHKGDGGGKWDAGMDKGMDNLVARAQMTELYKQSGGKQDGLYGPKTQKALESMAAHGQIDAEAVKAIKALHKSGDLHKIYTATKDNADIVKAIKADRKAMTQIKEIKAPAQKLGANATLAMAGTTQAEIQKFRQERLALHALNETHPQRPLDALTGAIDNARAELTREGRKINATSLAVRALEDTQPGVNKGLVVNQVEKARENIEKQDRAGGPAPVASAPKTAPAALTHQQQKMK